MNHQEKTREGNLTELMEFVLLDFAEVPHLQWFLLALFLIIYIIILMSNSTIFLLIKLDPALHSPMYFFLANFSFLEICYVSVTLPRMLVTLVTQRRISLVACATQMCLVFILGGTECLLLAVMAYDRYVAICNPLHYPVVMNYRVCIQLVSGSWITGIPVMIGQTYQIFSLHFCGPNEINHFFCDIPPILKLACGDTFINELLVFIVAVVFVMVPFILIVGSYSKIISTILKLSSATSRAKAFSTCSSHLIVVALFFGSGPKTSQVEGTDKVLSLFYTILTPMFNPMIYSLRNKDVIVALKKLLCNKSHKELEKVMKHTVLSRKHKMRKAEGNVSTVKQFILLGFSELSNLQGFLFGVFFVIYMVIIVGNSLIIILTRLDPTLYKPMYFFLANFSLLEMCYVSVTLPRMLANLWTQDRSISFLECATQMCFFLMLGATECFLLAVMAYDRYVAICNPLRYPLVMNQKTCVQLAIGSWTIGIPIQIGLTTQIFSLNFCNSNEINHFFCDTLPIIRLACGDISHHEMLIYIEAMLIVAVPFILILVSYSKIISTILKLPTASKRAKGFSTCSSHLLVVILFFGSATIAYLRPKSSHSARTDKLLSLFYTIVTPMFNPMIYSLRNKDVIAALRKVFLKK
ncbi:uncharacterized protein ACDL77_022816 [Rhynchocyon petersi]